MFNLLSLLLKNNLINFFVASDFLLSQYLFLIFKNESLILVFILFKINSTNISTSSNFLLSI